MSAQGYANQQFADEAHDDLRARQAERIEDDEVRQQLESVGSPVTDGSGAAAPDTTDAGPDAEPIEGYPMSVDRRAGSTHITVEHVDADGNERESDIQFGKPSGRASTQILSPIEEMEDDPDTSLSDLGGYIWGTLGSWAVDAERDSDFFADQTGLGEAIATLRELATGGINPEV